MTTTSETGPQPNQDPNQSHDWDTYFGAAMTGHIGNSALGGRGAEDVFDPGTDELFDADLDPAFDADEPQFYDAALPREEDMLRLPETRDVYDEALAEMLPELNKAFKGYWIQECVRVEQAGCIVVADKNNLTAREKGRIIAWKDMQAKNAPIGPNGRVSEATTAEPMLIDNAVRQDRYESMVLFAQAVGKNIIALKEAEPQNTAVTLFDIDDTLGRTPVDVDFFDLDDPNKIDEVTYGSMIINPAVPVLINWSHERYPGGVAEGIVSTKLQHGLEEVLVPRIRELCPQAFADTRYVVSMRDGRFQNVLGPMLQRMKSTQRKQIELERSGDLEAATEMKIPLREFLYAPLEEGQSKRRIYPEFSLLEGALDIDNPAFDNASFEDLKFIVDALLEHESRQVEGGTDKNGISIEVVDNWPSFDHVTPGHHKFRATELKDVNGRNLQFIPIDENPDFWGKENEAFVGYSSGVI